MKNFSSISVGVNGPSAIASHDISLTLLFSSSPQHIITNSTFRNCGYRSAEFDQYDQSPTRGCVQSEDGYGCWSGSSVFGFLTHSDQFTPEIMQGTRDIRFENCGRRFKFTHGDLETVSGRGQTWLDVDGSVSGLGEATVIASGLNGAKDWWGVDDEVVFEPQAPLRFIKKESGPRRSLGHITFAWDNELHDTVGSSSCRNDGSGTDCEAVGYMRHLGHKFSPSYNPSVNNGLPVTANPDVVGMIGGYGWLFTLNGGAPRQLNITGIEIDPQSTMLISIPYPTGTTFSITATPPYCSPNTQYTCVANYVKVSSVQEVREGPGNLYHFNAGTGVLTLRVIQFSNQFTGNPEFILPDYDTPGRWQDYALNKFERDGVLLAMRSWHNQIKIEADCSGSGVYCDGALSSFDPNVCLAGFNQVAYDTCCDSNGRCTYADGSRNF